jgi:hypothetical protein
METVPLRPSRFPDSGGIFIFANGVRMEEISRFDRQVKQVKIWDADCTCPYSPYGHVEGRTILLTWQIDDVAHFYWMVVVQWSVDTCHLANELWDTWPNHWRHVSLSLFIGYLFCKNVWVRGVRPRDLPHSKVLTHMR